VPNQTLELQCLVQPFRSGIFDTFTRADTAVALGTCDTGQTWAVETGSGVTYGIFQQKAYCVSGAQQDHGVVLNTLVADQFLASADIIVSAGYTAGVIFRSDGSFSSANKFIARIEIASGQSQIVVRRYVAGSATTLATIITNPQIVEGETATLQVHVFGSTIKIFLNGFLQRELTDANHLTRTRHGLATNTNLTKVFDNFVVGLPGGNPPIQLRANLLNTTTRTIQLRGAVLNTVTQTTQLRGKITPQTIRKIDLRAAVQTRVVILETAGDVMTIDPTTRVTHEDAGDFSVERVVLNGQDAYIWTLDTQFLSSRFANVTLRANIRATTPQTIQLRARLTNQAQQQIQLRARIAPRFFQFIQMRAKIVGPTTRTIQLRANLRATTTRTIQMQARIRRIEFQIDMRANIGNTTAKNLQMRARMTPQTLQQIDLRASITSIVFNTLQMRARIQPETFFHMRARILGVVTTTAEVNYNVAPVITTTLPVQFNAGDGAKVSHVLQMRARIILPIQTTLTVEVNVSSPMPDLPATRPTERIKLV
jgi:predicted nucleic acid-binding protein